MKGIYIQKVHVDTEAPMPSRSPYGRAQKASELQVHSYEQGKVFHAQW